MEITYGKLEEIAEKLRQYPAIEKEKRTPSKFEAISVLQAEIEALRQRGYSMEQIATSLRGEGIDISTATLRNYIQRIRQESSKANKTKKTTTKKRSVATINGTKQKPSESSAKPVAETTEKPDRQKAESSDFTAKEDTPNI